MTTFGTKNLTTMKKIILSITAAVFLLAAGNAFAQDKTETTATENVQTEENKQKEADALQKRIEQYTIKVEANKENLDYEAEMKRIDEMKARWEKLTGKTWPVKEEEKK